MIYEEIICKHDDMLDDGEEMTENKFLDIFSDLLHPEVDSSVCGMSDDEINEIIEKVGFIELCKTYKNVLGDLDALFNDDDICIKTRLIYISLYESVMEERSFEKYMAYWNSQRPDHESDEFNLRGERGEGEKEGEETEEDSEGEGEDE
jgi:hypothetical protein